MRTHRSLWHVIMRAGGSVGGAHRKPSAGAVRTRVVRGILVLGLVLGGLSAAALALPGHGSAGAAHVSSHRPAANLTGVAASNAARSRPWIF